MATFLAGEFRDDIHWPSEFWWHVRKEDRWGTLRLVFRIIVKSSSKWTNPHHSCIEVYWKTNFVMRLSVCMQSRQSSQTSYSHGQEVFSRSWLFSPAPTVKSSFAAWCGDLFYINSSWTSRITCFMREQRFTRYCTSSIFKELLTDWVLTTAGSDPEKYIDPLTIACLARGRTSQASVRFESNVVNMIQNGKLNVLVNSISTQTVADFAVGKGTNACLCLLLSSKTIIAPLGELLSHRYGSREVQHGYRERRSPFLAYLWCACTNH